ncbi:MAG: hypothetical protein J5W83_05575 [Candidatus Accumulibacter sp.]|jgi:hypothetical protein|uniref:hypothetical protein n=2 Tax=Accumulibacter sp. TaxID=2053492 RepID=UPI001B2CD4FA|nr:hypothetical protein [Accumulibacter sp.]MBO3701996.1 hypothetical protein [Accumulibacter sp.]
MIPPMKEVRIRSISRWLKGNSQGEATPPPEALSQRATGLDDQMIETFEAREDGVMDRLTKEGLWGTEDGTRQFRTERMEIWQEVCAEFLPTSGQESREELARMEARYQAMYGEPDPEEKFPNSTSTHPGSTTDQEIRDLVADAMLLKAIKKRRAAKGLPLSSSPAPTSTGKEPSE